MGDQTPVIEIRPVENLESLAASWRDLESRADGSFFQSWAWVGCLAAERFPEPWLLSARRADKVVALALFNRVARRSVLGSTRLFLNESGDEARDSIFVEHNGILVDRAERGLEAACLSALDKTQEDGVRRAAWQLSGTPEDALRAVPHARTAKVNVSRSAPYLDFAALAQSDAPVLDQLSANARQQIRRSLRAWEKAGPLLLEIAKSPEESRHFLEELKAFHQLYWTGRGKKGAFAEPFFERFHHALIRRAGSGQSVDVMRINAGERTVGYLYNLVHRGWVAAYQSGFAYDGDSDKLRPGLVSHLLAIEHYRRRAARLYDFLGGEARYKRSFANTSRELVWAEVRPSLLSVGRRGADA